MDFRSPTHAWAHYYGSPSDLYAVAAAATAARAALDALSAGRSDLAERLWGSIDGADLLTRWNDGIAAERAGGGLPLVASRPTPIGPKTSVARRALATQVYERDMYRCRYCDIPVVTHWPGGDVQRLVEAFPDLPPGLAVSDGRLVGSGRSGALTNRDTGKWLWYLAVPDHVFAASLGGPTNLDNLVTSCWGCNGEKNERTVDEIGVRSPLTGR
jgi:hypothetical protein